MTKISCPEHGPMSDGEVLDAARDVSNLLYELAMAKDYCARKLFLATLVASMAYKLSLDEYKVKDPNYPVLNLDLHMEEALRLGQMLVDDNKAAMKARTGFPSGIDVILLDPSKPGELHDFLAELFGEDPKGKKH